MTSTVPGRSLTEEEAERILNMTFLDMNYNRVQLLISLWNILILYNILTLFKEDGESE